MNVRSVVGREVPAEQVSEMLGKWFFRWSQRLSGYRFPYCQNNSCFVSPCAKCSVVYANVRVHMWSIAQRMNLWNSLRSNVAFQTHWAPFRDQRGQTPGFHEFSSLVLLGYIEMPLWQPFVFLLHFSFLVSQEILESFIGGGLSFSKMDFTTLTSLQPFLIGPLWSN